MEVLMTMIRCLKKVLAALCLAAAPFAASAAEPAQVVDTETGKTVSVTDAASRLASYDVVVLGEFHDSMAIHEAELAFLKALRRENGPSQILSMEMFERDTQSLLDDYLAGRVTEEAFLKGSRPWPQYRDAYRPLIEFAKGEHMTVLGGNIPRRMAAVLAKTGSLDNVAPEDKKWLPRKTYAPEGQYKTDFMAAMNGMAAHGMPINPARLTWMYEAQCLKDDAMAESIADELTAGKDVHILHLVGEFHSHNRMGLVAKLQALAPKAKIAVLAPVKTEGGTYQVQPGDKEKADYFLIIKQ